MPYDRGKGKSSDSAAEVRRAADIESILSDSHEEFYRTFVDFPRHQSDGIEHRFYLIKQRLEGRPCFKLSHRMFQEGPNHAIVAERHFYVGHTYNSLQVILGCFPIDEGVVLFYRNRTSTDQVAGVGSSLRHKIGRDMMRDEVINLFEAKR